ncbi:hydrogenase 4 subunit F [Acidihalobacter aeolianus]|uniref:Hydrogenase 4 subunit F n=1 Tax=Acidihalobacter aeolianus TaxID=2792603 RepID=A0A1D8K8Q2_9GAMM|nr:hydrogenase 4 subunit F [Acidihalobacter aeolianus]AOV17301.1 hydrogenase 4 subunit F [Acidihalobacter aeolianus]
MSAALPLVTYTPLAGALLLGLLRHDRLAGWLNVALGAVSFGASVVLAWEVARSGVVTGFGLRVDDFSVFLVVLTAFVGLTTAIFSRPYMQHVLHTRLTGPYGLRLYHAMYQSFLFTMLLALTTNNLGVLWVAVEGATLSTVMLVSLYRTPEAVEAAWKYFILCGVGIALALFGTVLVYYAAQHVLPHPAQGLNWSVLNAHRAQLQPAVMSIAFVFLLIGYGTKVGLVPMHQWLPDAHSEGPTPISAILSGLLLNVALYAVVRFKMLVDGSLAHTSHPHLAGLLMMGFGLVSFLVAGLFLHRQRDVKRLFSYSSIEHMGLMTFGFGLGGPLATFAALLHMLVHSLTKSAIFVTVGHATHLAGTQSIEHIRGLLRAQPGIGWPFLLGVAAIAGFPPFGIFTSEFLLLGATMHAAPVLTVFLLLGLVIAFAGLFRHLQPMVYGPAPAGLEPVKVNMLPVVLHLVLVLWLGLAIPAVLVAWLNQATMLIAGAPVL